MNRSEMIQTKPETRSDESECGPWQEGRDPAFSEWRTISAVPHPKVVGVAVLIGKGDVGNGRRPLVHAEELKHLRLVRADREEARQTHDAEDSRRQARDDQKAVLTDRPGQEHQAAHDQAAKKQGRHSPGLIVVW